MNQLLVEDDPKSVIAFIKAKLIELKYPARNGARCCLRGRDGYGNVTKCAIGHIIPDEIYLPSWEENSGSFLSSSNEDPFSLWMNSNYPKSLLVLELLQILHDFHLQSKVFREEDFAHIDPY